MARGRVIFYNTAGGYGLIEPEDADDEVFFQRIDVGAADVAEGQPVEFEVETGREGPRATDVTCR